MNEKILNELSGLNLTRSFENHADYTDDTLKIELKKIAVIYDKEYDIMLDEVASIEADIQKNDINAAMAKFKQTEERAKQIQLMLGEKNFIEELLALPAEERENKVKDEIKSKAFSQGY